MNQLQSRARELMPSVLLTLLSIVQALALELGWTKLKDSPWLFEGGYEAWVGWLMSATMLLGVILVWLYYTSLVMRFVWVPRIRDSIAPFAIGLLEFLMIELSQAATLHLWLYVLAVLFGFCAWTSIAIFRDAAQDGGNAEFFERWRPDELAGYLGPAIAVALLALAGLAVQIFPNTRVLHFACVLVAQAAIWLQLMQVRDYWNRSVFGDVEASDTEPEDT